MFTKAELLCISLYMGFSSCIVQTLLIREILTLCRGNELIIGVIFSLWFLGIYFGAQYKKSGSGNGAWKRVIASMFFLPLISFISVYSVKFSGILFPRFGTFYSLSIEILVSVLLILPVSFFAGFFFPSAVMLISDGAGKESGGVIYYIESFGSFAGGIVFSFILVNLINPIGIVSILLSLAALIIFFRKHKAFLALIIIPVALGLFSNSIERNIYEYTWKSTHIGELAEYERTRYQLIEIESYNDTVSIYGDGALIYTLPDRYETRGIFHLIESLRGDRKDILLTGSPGSLLYNLSVTNINDIFYIEQDPDTWELIMKYVKKYYNELNDKVSVINQDLRYFFNMEKQKFDMIVLMTPEPENIKSNRYYTKEFYSLCREHLKENGLLITQMHGFTNYMSQDHRNYLASIYAGFIREFPAHLYTSGDTVYLIGAFNKHDLPACVDDFVNEYSLKWKSSEKSGENSGFETEIKENFSAKELRTFFEKTQLEYFESNIIPLASKIRINSDFRPDAYWKNIVFTAFREKSALYILIRSSIFFPALMILLSLCAVLYLKKRFHSGSLIPGLQMYVTGFVSISTMIILMLVFQNSHGIIYHRIALITGLFMAGLALGGYLFNKLKIRLVYVFAALAASLVPALILTAGYSWLFWLLIVLFSFICGGVFPILFKSASGNEYYDTASMLDSMDHFGSIAGSLLAAGFILPVLGVQAGIVLNVVLVAIAVIVSGLRFR